MPITTTAGAYAVEDQVGQLQTMVGAADHKHQALKIDTITVVDTAQQKSELLILFFSKPPAVTSTDSNTLAITDAELAEKLIGAIRVYAAEYQDVVGTSIAVVQYPDIQVHPQDKASGENVGQDLYMLVLSKGTPTYGASSTALTVHVGVSR
jgi:hypothetical protein